jgi:sigma-B regulation protein RsbU (phosphoserine phosphatase)
VIDTDSGRGTYAHAGHPHALLGYAGGLPERRGPTGPIFGPIEGSWETGSMVINPGGKLIIFTDGLIEARDVTRAFYGEERLERLLATLDCPDAQPVIDEILADLDLFHPGRLADDVTLVVACRTPPAAPVEGDGEAVAGSKSEHGDGAGKGGPAGSLVDQPLMDDDVRVAEQALR